MKEITNLPNVSGVPWILANWHRRWKWPVRSRQVRCHTCLSTYGSSTGWAWTEGNELDSSLGRRRCIEGSGYGQQGGPKWWSDISTSSLGQTSVDSPEHPLRVLPTAPWSFRNPLGLGSLAFATMRSSHHGKWGYGRTYPRVEWHRVWWRHCQGGLVEEECRKYRTWGLVGSWWESYSHLPRRECVCTGSHISINFKISGDKTYR